MVCVFSPYVGGYSDTDKLLIGRGAPTEATSGGGQAGVVQVRLEKSASAEAIDGLY